MKEAERISFEVTDEKNNILWSTPYSTSKGFNQFRWNTVYHETSSDLPYFIHYNKFLPPGNYQFHVKTKEKKLTKDFNVYKNLKLK